jgi:hypothetical protein
MFLAHNEFPTVSLQMLRVYNIRRMSMLNCVARLPYRLDHEKISVTSSIYMQTDPYHLAIFSFTVISPCTVNSFITNTFHYSRRMISIFLYSHPFMAVISEKISLLAHFITRTKTNKHLGQYLSAFFYMTCEMKADNFTSNVILSSPAQRG